MHCLLHVMQWLLHVMQWLLHVIDSPDTSNRLASLSLAFLCHLRLCVHVKHLRVSLGLRHESACDSFLWHIVGLGGSNIVGLSEGGRRKC